MPSLQRLKAYREHPLRKFVAELDGGSGTYILLRLLPGLCADNRGLRPAERRALHWIYTSDAKPHGPPGMPRRRINDHDLVRALDLAKVSVCLCYSCVRDAKFSKRTVTAPTGEVLTADMLQELRGAAEWEGLDPEAIGTYEELKKTIERPRWLSVL